MTELKELLEGAESSRLYGLLNESQKVEAEIRRALSERDRLENLINDLVAPYQEFSPEQLLSLNSYDFRIMMMFPQYSDAVEHYLSELTGWEAKVSNSSFHVQAIPDKESKRKTLVFRRFRRDYVLSDDGTLLTSVKNLLPVDSGKWKVVVDLLSISGQSVQNNNFPWVTKIEV